MASDDGVVQVTVPPKAAASDTVVRITTGAAPDDAGPLLAAQVPVAVTPTAGSLATATVSIRYDAKVLAAAGSDPALLMTLIQDHDGRWESLDTTVDPATSTASARWPHFSNAIVGGVRSAGRWWIDHVATYGLGPRKTPVCDRKDLGWKKDAGWTFTATNATGGRMLVPPLDGCAAATGADGRHGMEITNRYWYAFRAPLPPGADQGLPEIYRYSSFEDTLIGLYVRLARGEIVIPGHSRAQVTVADRPAGQTVVWSARADPISMGLSLAMSVADVATFGAGKVGRAGLKAGEDALWDLRAAHGTPTIADIAEQTADPAWRRKTVDDYSASHGVPPSVLERFLNGMDLLNCAQQVGAQTWPAQDDTDLGKLWTFVSAVASQCRVQAAKWVLDKIYSTAQPVNQAKMAADVVKGLLDFKAEAATLQSSLAGWAKLIGSADYAHARLSTRQARDPRYDPFAGYDWSPWLLPSMSCDPELVEQSGFRASVELRTDLTGDGAPDYVLVGQCPASTSAWPIQVTVADGAARPGQPRGLGSVSGQEYWRTLTVATKKRKNSVQLVLTGTVVGADDPMCCPSHRVTLTVEWKKDHFAQVARSDRPT